MSRERGSPYRAYLLRCWREEGTPSCQAPRWRFSVEDILQHRSRRGFEDLDALVAFLRAELTDGGDESLDRAWPDDSNEGGSKAPRPQAGAS